MVYNDHLLVRVFLTPVELPFLGQKLYVDPTNYDSPEDALNEFASEIDPSVLVLEKLIGGGWGCTFHDIFSHPQYNTLRNTYVFLHTFCFCI